MYAGKNKRLGPGYSPIYKTNAWQKEQHAFEVRLGKYAYNHPRSHAAVNKALSRMKNVLWAYYHNQFISLGKQEFFLRAFTKDDPSSAGQVGRMVGKEIFNIVGKEFTSKIDDLLPNTNGNLREKMTAFYNAAYYNACGKSKKKAAKAINFKNIMQKIVTSDNRMSNYLINKLNLDKKSVEEIKRQSSKNIFKAGFLSGLHNIFSGPDVYSCPVMAFHTKDSSDSYIKNYLRYKARDHKNDPPLFIDQTDPSKLGYHRYDYQDKMGLNRSDREKNFQQKEIDKWDIVHDTTKYYAEPQLSNNPETKNEIKITHIAYSPIISGKFARHIPELPLNDVKKLQRELGFPLIAGMSGTTGRMLNTVKWLGFNHGDLLNFRLALMGWMLPEEDHSLYEILTGSHMVGVYGKEKLNDATFMDLNVDPLSENEIRENCGIEYISPRLKNNGKTKLFPHEVLYIKEQSNSIFVPHNRSINKLSYESTDESSNESSEESSEESTDSSSSDFTIQKAVINTAKLSIQVFNDALIYYNFKLGFRFKYSNFLYLGLRDQVYNKFLTKLEKHLKNEIKPQKLPENFSEYMKNNNFANPKIENTNKIFKTLFKMHTPYINDTFNKLKYNITNPLKSLINMFKTDNNGTPNIDIFKLHNLYWDINLCLKEFSDQAARFIINEVFDLLPFGSGMDKLLNDSYLASNMLQDCLQEAPKYTGPTYSNQKMRFSYYPGNIISTSIFISTHKDKPTISNSNSVVLVFNLKDTGVKLGNKDTDPVLIPPGSKFVVEDVETKSQKTNKVKYIYLKSIRNNSFKTPSSNSNFLNKVKYNSPRISMTKFY